MRPAVLLACALTLTACAPGAVLAAAMQPMRADALPVPQVRDLHYGDALFHHYVGDELGALVRLEAYEAWQRLPQQGREASLLAGGLYLSLGAHAAAARRFETLLAPPVPAPVADRAWFQLAELRYQRGLHAEALQALERIGTSLPATLQARREALHANTLMRLGRFDEAARLLASSGAQDEWSSYARLNLGVALVRAGRLSEARVWLDAVGTSEASTLEQLALRDRANVALGLALLQARQPREALAPLLRTRLQGPSASTALLGLGWAHAALDQPRDALVPWLELAGRPVRDAAVQEALLAVPYAFARAGASGQAAESYERALQDFETEAAGLEQAAERLRGGSLFEGVGGLDATTEADRGWLWRLRQMPTDPEARYLSPLLAGDGFQQGLQNLRDLAQLRQGLQRWQDDIGVFDDMILARERSRLALQERVAALQAAEPVAPLAARNAELVRRFEALPQDEAAAALAPAAQQAQWERVRQLQSRLDALPEGDVRDAMQAKLRLARGVLLWDLQRDERQRRFTQQRNLQAVQRGLAEAGQRWERVQRAHASAPGRTAAFAERLVALRQRLASLQARLHDLDGRQESALTSQALQALSLQQQRVEEYRIQARFELASLQDRSAAPPEAAPEVAP